MIVITDSATLAWASLNLWYIAAVVRLRLAEGSHWPLEPLWCALYQHLTAWLDYQNIEVHDPSFVVCLRYARRVGPTDLWAFYVSRWQFDGGHHRELFVRLEKALRRENESKAGLCEVASRSLKKFSAEASISCQLKLRWVSSWSWSKFPSQASMNSTLTWRTFKVEIIRNSRKVSRSREIKAKVAAH